MRGIPHRLLDWAHEQTGRGVPLVELRTTNHISCWTDSNGIVAWNEPGLMERPVYFSIQSPGYTFPGGGKTLDVSRGGRAELKIRRLNIAERLYRVTGQGIYRDSLLTGFPIPIREPALNGMVMGQDTVRAVIYHGKYTFYWPVPNPFFDQDGGRLICFQGTYTDSFSGNPVITPRYNYNEIMYRLALDDPRLFLPAPVYRLQDGRYLMREGVVAAHAWDQVELVFVEVKNRNLSCPRKVFPLIGKSPTE